MVRVSDLPGALALQPAKGTKAARPSAIRAVVFEFLMVFLVESLLHGMAASLFRAICWLATL
jgi:hypothetical protein